MNQKSNQSKEQLDSQLPTNVLPEETLFALCKAEIHEVSMKLKKALMIISKSNVTLKAQISGTIT